MVSAAVYGVADLNKRRFFPDLAFKESAIRSASDRFVECVHCGHSKCQNGVTYIGGAGNVQWDWDSVEEFFAFYRTIDFSNSFYVGYGMDVYCTVQKMKLELSLIGSSRGTTVTVRGSSISDIEAVHSAFEIASSEDRVLLDNEDLAVRPVIFIGHGRSQLWRDLKDHLQDMQGYQVEAYEMGARAGHAIRDILDSMLSKSSFALLVMTAEDEMVDGTYQPRMNVVHELGLFQGSLGWLRTIMLLEDGAEDFSNMAGIEQIRFSGGNIKEVYGDVVATLRREFPS